MKAGSDPLTMNAFAGQPASQLATGDGHRIVLDQQRRRQVEEQHEQDVVQTSARSRRLSSRPVGNASSR